jgi:hypothetical protein
LRLFQYFLKTVLFQYRIKKIADMAFAKKTKPRAAIIDLPNIIEIKLERKKSRGFDIYIVQI